jgi:hypothetical protein
VYAGVAVMEGDGLVVPETDFDGVRVAVPDFDAVRVGLKDVVAVRLGVGLGLGTKAQHAGLGIVQAKSSKSPAAEIATQSWPR